MKLMQALTLAIVFLGATVLSAPSPSSRAPKCGYESCPATKPGMLNVHLLAHTHMDLGWLKTVDQYFYGTKNKFANVGVRYIFDSVLDELEKDARRRFIFVETGFFNLWWKNVNETKKHRFDALVQSGRMEFISGGWVMNDEACVHYSNTIDQMTYGIRKLKDTFGNCGVPRIGWQIDPFGHSREYASLLAQMGMDGYFFGRLDYQDFKARKTGKQLEFIWGASENLGTAANMFTGILPNTYSPPRGFCFDVYCFDDPIVDDPDSDEYNVDSRIDSFVTYAREQADFYKTNNIPVTMGDDFNYQSAGHWFINLDKLVHHANLVSDKTKIHLLYSTPSCYLKALHESGTKWPTKTDDFFPYASDPHAYWTGYFTSRAAFKYLDRYTNNQLQVAKQLGVLAGPKEVTEASLNVLREALAVGQHHDAITGTAKQAVANNYVKHISIGQRAADKYTNYAFEKLVAKHPKARVPQFVRCHTLNVSACEITESSTQITVLVYNPQGRPVHTHLRIPVSGNQWRVVDASGSDVPTQVARIPAGVAVIPERDSKADQEIVFVAKVPALGFATYFVEADSHYYRQRSRHHKKDLSIVKTASCGEPGVKEMVLQGKAASAIINCTSGLLSAISWKGTTVRVNQSFYWYQGHPGNNTKFQFRASGAYIFRPTKLEPLPVADKAELVHVVKNGSIVHEVHQKFSDWLTQVIRVYEVADFVEFDWVVGSIPVDDEVGKEIVTRFDTELQTDELFYTDSNGREILERRRNFRPTWKLDVQEPVAGNYYPVNSKIYIRDTTRDIQLTVLTDRSQGGSSIRNGSVELMVHRRLLYDDAFGVGEALNESYYGGKGLVVRGTHRVTVSPLAQASLLHRPLAQALYATPVLFFAPVDATTYRAECNTSCSALAKPLPPNVHLLTLEHWSEDKVLLRLEHFYEKKDHAGELSKPANFSLQASFVRTITGVTEMNLAVTKTKEETSRLEFEADESDKANVLLTGNDEVPTTVFGSEYYVYLTPMQIRTFLVTFSADDTDHVMCFERHSHNTLI